MKIFSLNVNRFGKTVNFKYKQSTPMEIANWNSDFNCNLRKAIAKDIAKYVTDNRNNIDIALFQEVDYQECFEEFVSYFVRLGYQVNIPQGIGFDPMIAFTNMIVAKPDIKIAYQPTQYCNVIARWQECKINLNDKEIYILNLHADRNIIDRKDRDQYRKQQNENARFYYPLQKYIPMRKDEYFVVVGDYNAASNDDRAIKKKETDEVFIFNTEILNIFKINGFVDIKDKENIYTYYPYKNKQSGRRLDHCFISKNVSKTFNCKGYTDETVNALVYPDTGFTDHSAIILEIN